MKNENIKAYDKRKLRQKVIKERIKKVRSLHLEVQSTGEALWSLGYTTLEKPLRDENDFSGDEINFLDDDSISILND